MGRRLSATAVALLVALALTSVANANPGQERTLRVDSVSGLEAAVKQLRLVGGTVVLTPGRYGRVVVGPRPEQSGTLTIQAEAGASTGVLLLTRTHDVRVVGLSLTPLIGNAVATIRHSRRIRLEGLDVSATGTHLRAHLVLRNSVAVAVVDSRFADCGEGYGLACLLTGSSSYLLVERDHFDSCRGCDFIHGHFGRNLVIRDNVFGPALAGDCGFDSGAHVCNHQDAVQAISGRYLLVERNSFDIVEGGAAQIYVSSNVQGVVVRDNTLAGRNEALRPGYVVPVDIRIGNDHGPVPTDVTVTGNVALGGATRQNGGAPTSLAFSYQYADMPLQARPYVFGNELARMQDPHRFCDQVREQGNQILDGGSCG